MPPTWTFQRFVPSSRGPATGEASGVAWATVRWVMAGKAAPDGGFDSGTLDENTTFAQTFEEAGTFDYVCAIHPNMTGTVTVTA